MVELREMLLARGAALVGFADMTPVSEEDRAGLPMAVSIAVALDPAVIAAIADGPTAEYAAHYKQRNALLDALAAGAAGWLAARGHRAAQAAATNRGGEPVRLAHKTAATLSGLGWIGRCALLVTPEFGSAVRLTTVLTDALLPAGQPATESRCGECRACVEHCPGSAPRGAAWRRGVSRDQLLDVEACRRGVREASSRRGLDVLVCGRCIAVCPRTQAWLRRAGRASAGGA